MSEYGKGGRCPECDGTGGIHYSGCTYEGSGSTTPGLGGSGSSKVIFALFLIIGIGVAVFCMPFGGLIIYFGAKVSGV